MSEQELRYDILVEQALRGVVRSALEQVLSTGLPGEHHFYITFRTDHPGVEIPSYLRERYPTEMTIVLQHQFWDLEVGEERFAVTLSFSAQPSRLSVPFSAVTAFTDPSVRFALQFDSEAESEEGEEEAIDEEAMERSPSSLPTPAHGDPDLPIGPGIGQKKSDSDASRQGDDAEAGSRKSEQAPGKVISLDAFRKK